MKDTFGFLNINKLPNCTSHDIVATLRKSLGIKKIGHFGTLDPFSTGVLVIGLNGATRLFEYLQSDKTYLAEIVFGIETDTNDITGKTTHASLNIPTLKEVKEKIQEFVGKVSQVPPIFSAVKINGKRAYNLARKNQITLSDIKEKEIEIYSIDIISYDFSKNTIKLNIHCSSGTYIRSIARDLGRVLNTYATLISLKRIRVGDFFTIEQSITLQNINKQTLEKCLIAPSLVLKLPKTILETSQSKDILHGMAIKVEKHLSSSLLQQIYDKNNKLIAIGTMTNDCIIKPVKVFL